MDTFRKLLDIMASLRAENGCPWDREQTHESLKPFLVEEAYEVLEAIDEGDPLKIKEDLGDLLFQIVFHAQLGKERGEFDMDSIIDGISRKMVSRHPHVFGDAQCATSEEVRAQWDERKKEEGKLQESLLEGVPTGLPSLLRAQRLQARAARVGFDWARVEEVLGKLEEELGEFRDALGSGDKARIEEELGDVLFVLVNVSRFVEVSPEDALRKTIHKFISRFRYIERKAAEAGKSLHAMTLEEMDVLWEEAKRRGAP
ncbi:MAG: nucleoside triphosphate pyrophosphohydrolase [Thermodesulfovibrionales bacterium]